MIRIISILLVTLFFLYRPIMAEQYFVSVDGRDTNPGSIEKPFRTLAHAAGLMKTGDVCIVRGGVYRESIHLDKINDFNEIWTRFAAYPGETVILSGTDVLIGKWSVYRGKIHQMKVDQVFDQLFVDGRMMTEARWPDCPFENRWDADRWARVGKGSVYGTIVDPELAKTGIDWTGAIATLNICGFQCWTRIVQNHQKGQDYFQHTKDLGDNMAGRKPDYSVGRHYFLSGKLEALDSPGEWFMERDTGTLYLWTPDGKDPKHHQVEVKVRDFAFEVSNSSFVEFKGFHFFATTLKMETCGYCVVDNCHFRFSTFARLFKEGEDHLPAGSGYVGKISHFLKDIRTLPSTFISGSHNTFKNCSVADSDGPGLVIEGWYNVVDNCLIHDVGWRSFTPASGIESNTSDVTIRRCTVFKTGNVPVRASAGTGKKVVEYNHLYYGGMNTTDGACVQTGGVDCAGTVLRYNWAHDYIAFVEGSEGGGKGLRGDDVTRGLTVHHNVVWNCRSQGIIVKGDHNRVYNNTVFNIQKTDILMTKRPEPFKPWSSKQWPYLLKAQNAHSETVNNYGVHISGRFDYEPVQEPPLGKVEHNFQGDDPGLNDPDHFDFRPKRNSPLVDAGQSIEGFTDGYIGDAPDIGAYEHGGEYWVPGHRNLLWLLPGDRTGQLKVLLAIPPLEDITVQFSDNTDARMTFTPDDWMTPRVLKVKNVRGIVHLKISGYGLDEEVSLEGMDELWGMRVPFHSVRVGD